MTFAITAPAHLHTTRVAVYPALLLLKASKTRLVSSERSFKKLTEAYEFYLIWLKDGGTVTSQSTVKNLMFSSIDLSSLLAYNFLVACT